MAGCYDCGAEYGGLGWIEAIIPDKVWDMIRPEGCAKGTGLLCICCISRRLERKGLKNVPVWLWDILRNWEPRGTTDTKT